MSCPAQLTRPGIAELRDGSSNQASWVVLLSAHLVLLQSTREYPHRTSCCLGEYKHSSLRQRLGFLGLLILGEVGVDLGLVVGFLQAWYPGDFERVAG